MSFTQLHTTVKGYAGEDIVRRILEGLRWTVYDSKADRPHVVDFICHRSGKRLFAVDVKTYPRRWCCPDTGIDTRDFEKYQGFENEHRIPVHLVFVDEIEQAVYGGRLRYLARHASPDGRKVYFPLERMRLHRHLFADELEEIRAVSTVDPARYQNTELFFPWARVQAMAGK